MSQVIQIAICADNKDPKGLGRIRYSYFSEQKGPSVGAIDYEPWSDRDPFVAQPFLPSNINFIPEQYQSVKILCYDSDKNTVNQEYIAGPFTTMFDYNSQNFSQQVAFTSYGASAKQKPDILKNGKLPPESDGVFANDNEYGIYGKYGSDLIFTENGMILRGGKLLSKEAASETNRVKMLNVPKMAEKTSKLYLKKFPKSITLETKEIPKISVESANLKNIVEYTVDDLNTPTKVDVFVYKVSPKVYGPIYASNYFTQYTELDYNYLTLINLSGNTGSTPTFSIPVTTTDDAFYEIRNILYTIHTDGLKGMKTDDVKYSLYTSEDIHPFYFRPTKEFNERTGNDTEKLKILNNVHLREVNTSGLIWSITQITPPTNVTTQKQVNTVKNPNSPEQTFGALISDKIYFLSTDTNETGKSIHFEELSKYELSQEDYIQKIDPNTYGTVRGEILLELLYSIINVLLSHVHNINEPYARLDNPIHNRMMDLFEKMENDLLNKSIRIN